MLKYVVPAQGVQMEDEKIKIVKNWPKPKSVRDILVFLGFANFYQCFIQDFSEIAGPLTSMLKTISSTYLSTISQLLIDMANKDKVVKGERGGNETNLLNLSVSKKFTGASYLNSKNAKKGGSNIKKGVKAAKTSDYLTPVAKKVFNYLWHKFI